MWTVPTASPLSMNGRWAATSPKALLQQTGRPLDVALEGEGLFTLQTEAGERFTRDGSFTLNADGELTASDGARVLDDRPAHRA
jgi:flagellar basal body rod protein FlgG